MACASAFKNEDVRHSATKVLGLTMATPWGSKAVVKRHFPTGTLLRSFRSRRERQSLSFAQALLTRIRLCSGFVM